MKRGGLFILLAITFLLLLCGCSNQSKSDNTINTEAHSLKTVLAEMTRNKSEDTYQTNIPNSFEHDGNNYISTSDINNSVEQSTSVMADLFTEPSTQVDTKPINTTFKNSNDTILNQYKAVLQNDSSFFDIVEGENLKINQLLDLYQELSGTVEITEFAVVDLDSDEIPEIILWETINSHVNFGVKILKYQNNEIFGFSLGYRSFQQLKVDGTFQFSGGAFDNGFGTINFDTEYKEMADLINKKTYCQSNTINNDIIYFVDNRIASSDEFAIAIDQQAKKTDVTWYEFSDENIQTLLS